jgi:hypothetical protein
MATRATIIILDWDEEILKLYHHRDWYESGVWRTIKKVFWHPLEETKETKREDLIKKLYELEIIQPGREIEDLSIEHWDIEFLYYVNIKNWRIFYYYWWFWEDELKKAKNYKWDLTWEIIEKQELRCLKNHYETSYKDF